MNYRNDRTLFIFRVMIFVGVVLCVLAIFIGPNSKNNPANSVFNEALKHSFIFDIVSVVELFLSVPMLIDMIMDIVYKAQDRLVAERFVFALSVICANVAILASKSSDRIAQVAISFRYVRFLCMSYTLWASLYQLQPHIWNSPSVIICGFNMVVNMSIVTYYSNGSPESVKVSLICKCIAALNYVPSLIYTVKSSIFIYNRSQKRKRTTGYRHFTNEEMMSLFIMYSFQIVFYSTALYYMFETKPCSAYVKRNGTELAAYEWHICFLILFMALFPTRMMRYETQRVRDTLDSKQKIARHAYCEMKQPLNQVVAGLAKIRKVIHQKYANDMEISEFADEVDDECEGKRDEGSEMTHKRTLAPLATVVEQLNHKEAINELVNSVSVSSASAVDILNEMLMLDRLNVGLMDVNMQYYCVRTYVNYVLSPFRLLAQQKLIKLKLVDRLGVRESSASVSGSSRRKMYLTGNGVSKSSRNSTVNHTTRCAGSSSNLYSNVDPNVDPSSNHNSNTNPHWSHSLNHNSNTNPHWSHSLNHNSNTNPVNFGTLMADSIGTQYCICIDSMKIGQVLRNFLSNALTFTPKGGSVVVVIRVVELSNPIDKNGLPNTAIGRMQRYLKSKRLQCCSNGAFKCTSPTSVAASNEFGRAEYNKCMFTQRERVPYIRIAVTDTGAGMSKDTIRRLFSDYKQYDVNVQGGGGSGFGLKIAKGMAELHNGTVGVSSNGVGRGSTFYVELPLSMLEHNETSCCCQIDDTGLIKKQ